MRASVLLLAVVLSLVSTPAYAAPDASGVYRRASPSVVTIACRTAAGETSQGSGVVVGDGEVVTNRHVVKDAEGFILVRQGERSWRAEVAGIDSAHDLALLHVLLLPNERFALLVAKPRRTPLTIGEPAYAIGAPRGLEQTLSDGLISGTSFNDEAQLVQTTAAISPGSSGGGLFDAHAMLVGITTMYLKDSQSLNFAVSTRAVDALRRQVSTAPQPVHRLSAAAPAAQQAAATTSATPPQYDLPTAITDVAALVVIAEVEGPVKSSGGLTESRLAERVASRLRAFNVKAYTSQEAARADGVYALTLYVKLGSLHIDNSVFYPWDLDLEVWDSTNYIGGGRGIVVIWNNGNFGYGGSNVVMDQVLEAVDGLARGLASAINKER